jgi:hypothetical protein
MSEHFETGSKKGRARGRAQKSLDLIEAMYQSAAECEPITGRGVGYKLFAAGLIPSMSRQDIAKVYRLLKEAREEGKIPWDWIVDETRSLEIVSSWGDPKQLIRCAINQYRKSYWDQQPSRVEVWSEKGTIRGVLAPVLDKYGVGVRYLHGFNGATSVHEVADDRDKRTLTALYIGDFDPSGMCMSAVDLPKRLLKYGGSHVALVRIAIVETDIAIYSLPTFPASDKKDDTRHDWFVRRHGRVCCELDAMDPNDLRDRVERAICDRIEDQDAWDRCKNVERAEKESLQAHFGKWRP